MKDTVNPALVTDEEVQKFKEEHDYASLEGSHLAERIGLHDDELVKEHIVRQRLRRLKKAS